MLQTATEQERRAQEFCKARAALVTAALSLQSHVQIEHSGIAIVEVSMPLDVLNHFQRYATAYRLAEARLTSA
jgi:hypothetical protein